MNKNDLTKMSYYMKNIHDQDGRTKEKIMNPDEVIQAVENWLENNSFAGALIEEGVWRYDQTYGRTAYVEIDTRDGEISTGTTTPNQYGDSDSFFITLASTDLFEEDWQDCLGDDHMVLCDESILDKWLDHSKYNCVPNCDNDQYKINANNGSGIYSVYFRDFDCNAEEWVDFWNSNLDDFDDWQTRVDNCADYYLENCADNWEENITDYYER